MHVWNAVSNFKRTQREYLNAEMMNTVSEQTEDN